MHIPIFNLAALFLAWLLVCGSLHRVGAGSCLKRYNLTNQHKQLVMVKTVVLSPNLEAWHISLPNQGCSKKTFSHLSHVSIFTDAATQSRFTHTVLHESNSLAKHHHKKNAQLTHTATVIYQHISTSLQFMRLDINSQGRSCLMGL